MDGGPTPLPASTEGDVAKWYLVQCKPREDERALENLQRQRFECYWPVLRAERRYPSGRKYLVREALFPGYLFIRLNCVDDNWGAIRSTRGVNRIVRFDEKPTAIADEIVDGIRERLAGPAGEKPFLKPGERVRIAEGAFAHLEAIFVARDGDERVVLLLNILQKDQQLSFPVGSVRKVG